MTWQLIIVSDVPLGERCATRAVQKSFGCSTSRVLEGVKLLSPHNVAQMDQADLPYGPFDVVSATRAAGCTQRWMEWEVNAHVSLTTRGRDG